MTMVGPMGKGVHQKLTWNQVPPVTDEDISLNVLHDAPAKVVDVAKIIKHVRCCDP